MVGRTDLQMNGQHAKLIQGETGRTEQLYKADNVVDELQREVEES